MALFFISLFAGVLTVLSPCVLPLLPIILGSGLDGKNKFKPYIITGSLAVSLALFTILLKGTTVLININPDVWKWLSGGIVIFLGLTYLFPQTWNWINLKFGLSNSSDQLLHKASGKKGWVSSALTGTALAPVFASCSPTYSLILFTVLPVNFTLALVYILAYCIGLAMVLLAIILFGRKVTNNLRFAANPDGWFRRTLGSIFILIGISVLLGLDKQLETNIINNGGADWIIKLEESLLKNLPK
jgi:cytochrome c-type biogenesis protein